MSTTAKVLVQWTVHVVVISTCCVSMLRAEEKQPAPPFGAGQYTLHIRSDAVPKDQRDVYIPITISEPENVDPENVEIVLRFRFSSDKEWGNPMSGVGVLHQSQIKWGFTAPERNTIISYHGIGTVTADDSANGKLTCFRDGKKMFDAEWTLKKQEDP